MNHHWPNSELASGITNLRLAHGLQNLSRARRHRVSVNGILFVVILAVVWVAVIW